MLLPEMNPTRPKLVRYPLPQSKREDPFFSPYPVLQREWRIRTTTNLKKNSSSKSTQSACTRKAVCLVELNLDSMVAPDTKPYHLVANKSLWGHDTLPPYLQAKPYVHAKGQKNPTSFPFVLNTCLSRLKHIDDAILQQCPPWDHQTMNIYMQHGQESKHKQHGQLFVMVSSHLAHRDGKDGAHGSKGQRTERDGSNVREVGSGETGSGISGRHTIPS